MLRSQAQFDQRTRIRHGPGLPAVVALVPHHGPLGALIPLPRGLAIQVFLADESCLYLPYPVALHLLLATATPRSTSAAALPTGGGLLLGAGHLGFRLGSGRLGAGLGGLSRSTTQGLPRAQQQRTKSCHQAAECFPPQNPYLKDAAGPGSGTLPQAWGTGIIAQGGLRRYSQKVLYNRVTAGFPPERGWASRDWFSPEKPRPGRS